MKHLNFFEPSFPEGDTWLLCAALLFKLSSLHRYNAEYSGVPDIMRADARYIMTDFRERLSHRMSGLDREISRSIRLSRSNINNTLKTLNSYTAASQNMQFVTCRSLSVWLDEALNVYDENTRPPFHAIYMCY